MRRLWLLWCIVLALLVAACIAGLSFWPAFVAQICIAVAGVLLVSVSVDGVKVDE